MDARSPHQAKEFHEGELIAVFIHIDTLPRRSLSHSPFYDIIYV